MGWQLCRMRGMCERCGEMVKRAWFYWATPSLYTHCVCETCAGDNPAETEEN